MVNILEMTDIYFKLFMHINQFASFSFNSEKLFNIWFHPIVPVDVVLVLLMPMMLKMKKQEGKCELSFPMFCSDVFIVSDIVVDLKERDQSDGKIDASSFLFPDC